MSAKVLTKIEIQGCVCMGNVQLNVLRLTDTHVMFNYLDHPPLPSPLHLLFTSQLSSKLVKADGLSWPTCFFSFFTSTPPFLAKTSVFLILIARCDPLHHHPSSFFVLFFFCWSRGSVGPCQTEPFVHVQGSVKQIRADRYGNDSRKKGLECVWGLGVCVCVCLCVRACVRACVHCLIDHQKEGITFGIPEQKICQGFVHFLLSVSPPSFAMLHYSFSFTSNFSPLLIPHRSVFFCSLLAVLLRQHFQTCPVSTFAV